jgi:hypothetical protein
VHVRVADEEADPASATTVAAFKMVSFSAAI